MFNEGKEGFKEFKKRINDFDQAQITLEDLKKIFPNLVGIINGSIFISEEEGDSEEVLSELEVNTQKIFKKVAFQLNCHSCEGNTTHRFIDIDESLIYGIKCLHCYNVGYCMKIEYFNRRYLEGNDFEEFEIFRLEV